MQKVQTITSLTQHINKQRIRYSGKQPIRHPGEQPIRRPGDLLAGAQVLDQATPGSRPETYRDDVHSLIQRRDYGHPTDIHSVSQRWYFL